MSVGLHSAGSSPEYKNHLNGRIPRNSVKSVDKPSSPSFAMIGSFLMAIGLALLLGAALSGDVEVTIFVVFPVISIQGGMGVAGVLLLFAGIVLLFFTLPMTLLSRLPGYEVSDGEAPDQREVPDQPVNRNPVQPARTRTGRKSGAVIFIGPLPIVISGNPRINRIGGILFLIILAVLFVVYLLS